MASLPQLPSFPVTNCNIRVLLVHAVSPSCFYLRFPNDVHDAAQLGLGEQLRSCSSRHEKFKASLAKFYEENPKMFLLSSLPAPGSLIVVKKENVWERALVLDEDDSGEDVSGGGDLKVFLVDEGKPTKICLNNIRYAFHSPISMEKLHTSVIFRRLHPEFQSLASQAVLCRLANVEPLGDSWTTEANAFFASFVGAKNLRAKTSSKGLPHPEVQVHLKNRSLFPSKSFTQFLTAVSRC